MQWINHYSRKDTNHHIKGSDTAANRRTLVIVPFSAVIDDRLGGGRLDTFTLPTALELDIETAANWDAQTPTDYTVAATRAGKDFYYYACIPASGNVPVIKLSANSTYPSGYTANNSRKIGGFHTECFAVGTISGHPLTGFLAGDVLPRSIWDLKFLPHGPTNGMIWAGAHDFDSKNVAPIWVSIYLPSGTTPTSAFNVAPATNIFLDWVDKFNLIGGRMLKWHEFIGCATGAPEKLAYSPAITVAGGNSVSSGVRAISNIGCEDITGVGQLIDRIFTGKDYTAPSFQHVGINIPFTLSDPLEGEKLYLKFVHGRPEIHANIAASVWIPFSDATIKLLLVADADAATGGHEIGLSLSGWYRFTANNTETALDALVETSNPDYLMRVYHSAAAFNTNIRYDNVTHSRLESDITGRSSYIDRRGSGEVLTDTGGSGARGYIVQGNQVGIMQCMTAGASTTIFNGSRAAVLKSATQLSPATNSAYSRYALTPKAIG